MDVATLMREFDREIVLKDGGRVRIRPSAILDRAARWIDLARWVVEREAPGAWVVDLNGGTRPEPGLRAPSGTSD